MEILPQSSIKEVENFFISRGKYPVEILMENAATALFSLLNEKGFVGGKKIMILCGPSNNGGDGLALGRKLVTGIANQCSESRGKITIYLFETGKYTALNQLQQDILENYDNSEIFAFRKFPENLIPGPVLSDVSQNPEQNPTGISGFIENLRSSDIIIDALLGFGVKGKISEKYGNLIGWINKEKNKKSFVLSVDLPSGMAEDFDNPCIESDLVCNLGYYKLACFLPFNRIKIKEINCLDIEFPPSELYSGPSFPLNRRDIEILYADHREMKKIKGKFPELKRSRFSNKGNYGRVVVFTDSMETIGAGIMSALASYNTGTGLTYIAAHPQNLSGFKIHYPQLIGVDYSKIKGNPLFGRADVFILGPGFGNDKDLCLKIADELSDAANSGKKGKRTPYIIVDADAINLISQQDTVYEKFRDLSNLYHLIFTPHLIEFTRLTGLSAEMINFSIVNQGIEFIKSWNASIIIKTFSLFCFTDSGGNRSLTINRGGNSGLSKGGTGDILTGFLGSLLAQGFSVRDSFLLLCYCFDSLENYFRQHSVSPQTSNYENIIQGLTKAISGVYYE